VGKLGARSTLLLDPFIKFHCYITLLMGLYFDAIFEYQNVQIGKFKILWGAALDPVTGAYIAPQTS